MEEKIKERAFVALITITKQLHPEIWMKIICVVYNNSLDERSPNPNMIQSNNQTWM